MSIFLQEISVLAVSLGLKVIQLWISLRMQWSIPDQDDICFSFTDDRYGNIKAEYNIDFLFKLISRSWVQWESNYSIQCQGSNVSKVCNTCAGMKVSRVVKIMIFTFLSCQIRHCQSCQKRSSWSTARAKQDQELPQYSFLLLRTGRWRAKVYVQFFHKTLILSGIINMSPE